MDIGKLILTIINGAGITPSSIVALVALYIMYRQSMAKDKIIDKLSDAVKCNTVAMAEIKTILSTFLVRGVNL